MKQDKYIFKTEGEREVGVCIAIQKIGIASVQEIIQKIEEWGGKLTEKQVTKSAENLRRRDLLSIDLTEKSDQGISIKRYVMKKIKLAIPEVAQIKDIIDDSSLNPLKEELDRSKKTQKKGLKQNDYYEVEIVFDVEGDVQGFIPDDKGVIKHYRNSQGRIVFHPYHFKNWLRNNLPLINRASSTIGDIYFETGTVKLNGSAECPIIDKYITNVESGFSSSRGTGGRGVKKVECLPVKAKVITCFRFPRELISPERIREAFDIICKKGGAFGGGAKLSTGKLKVGELQIKEEQVWEE